MDKDERGRTERSKASKRKTREHKKKSKRSQKEVKRKYKGGQEEDKEVKEGSRLQRTAAPSLTQCLQGVLPGLWQLVLARVHTKQIVLHRIQSLVEGEVR